MLYGTYMVLDSRPILTVLDTRQTEIHASHRNCRNRPSRSCLLAPRLGGLRSSPLSPSSVVRVARTDTLNSIACPARWHAGGGRGRVNGRGPGK